MINAPSVSAQARACFRMSLAQKFAFFSITPLLIGVSAFAQNISSETVQPPPVADDTVIMPEFQVSSARDKGYQAGNSVSATRISTPIKDLPFAVTAFTPQFIADIGARDLWDIVQYAPSVTSAGREFVAGNAVYNIRGFDQSPQHDGFTGEAYVDTTTVERVEVVKGPASVLYGQVSPGGLVNYITKRPKNERFAKLTGKLGSYDFYRVEADINQPIIPKTLLFRFNGAWENALQYIDGAQSHTSVFAPSVTWNITDRIALNVTYQKFIRLETPEAQMLPNTEVATAASMVPVGGVLNPKPALSNSADSSDPGFLGYYPLPRDFNYASNNDRRDTDFESVNAELSAKIASNWTARGNFNWNKNYNSFKNTGLGTVYVSAPAGYTAKSFADLILADRNNAALSQHAYLLRRYLRQTIWGEGMAAQVEAAGKYKFGSTVITPLAGAYWTSSYNNNNNQSNAVANYAPAWDLKNPATINKNTDFNPDPLAYTTKSRSVTNARAAYAVLNASFFDQRLMAIVGARYNTMDSQSWNYLKPNPDGTPYTDGKYKANKTTPQAGIGVKITRDMLLYASYSESFVQNAASLMKDGSPAGPAKPTTATGYEAGLKTDFLGGRISSTVSVYQINQKDRLVRFNSFVNGVTFANTRQGTEDRSRGIEAEVTYSPMDNLQIYASIAEADIRTTKVPPGYEYYLGAHPEATAKTLANLWARYSFKKGPVKGLWVGAGFNYTSKKAQRTNNKNLFLPSYVLWNASIGYDWKWNNADWSVIGEWKNMTDEDYNPANQQRGLPSRANLSLSLKF